MTEWELRKNFINLALSFKGVTQGSAKHAGLVDTYNRHKPLARGYKLRYSDAWCSAFVSAIAIMSNLTDIIPTEVGVGEHVKLFQKMGIWVEDDAFVPTPGDLVIYDWEDTGKGDNKGTPDHIGIVTSVSPIGINVIEGNKGGKVDLRVVPLNGRYIRGFATPDFASHVDYPWYHDAQEWAKINKIADGTRPEETATRAEVWQMLYNYRKTFPT